MKANDVFIEVKHCLLQVTVMERIGYVGIIFYRGFIAFYISELNLEHMSKIYILNQLNIETNVKMSLVS